MLRFGAIIEKMALKTSDFRDLLLDGAIFIVGNSKLATNDFMRMLMIIKCFACK